VISVSSAASIPTSYTLFPLDTRGIPKSTVPKHLVNA